MKTIITTSVKIAASYIRKGEVAAFPTETVYGLGADAYNEKAVKKIFKAKGRPKDNPLIVHVASKKDIEVLAKDISPYAKKIINKFFPGPVTVILKKNEIVPDIVTSGLDTIAIRMPASRISRELIRLSGVPIAAPSANLSGSPSPTGYRHVLHDFNGMIPCILKGPDAKHGLESTVIDCTGKHPVILRPGVITLEDIRKIDKKAIFKKGRGNKIKSPGLKYRHYAPKAKVKLISDFGSRISDRGLGIADLKIKSAYLGLNKASAKKFTFVKICKSKVDYAKSLFSFFRECDGLGIKIIYCQKVEEKGIGLAIMNRIKKAAGGK
jgi:L-threonylcarbamoyladenylate synthase